jgi:hypothetical protein
MRRIRARTLMRRDSEKPNRLATSSSGNSSRNSAGPRLFGTPDVHLSSSDRLFLLSPTASTSSTSRVKGRSIGLQRRERSRVLYISLALRVTGATLAAMTSPDIGNLRLASDSDNDDAGFSSKPEETPAYPQTQMADNSGEICCARAQWLHSGDEPEIFVGASPCCKTWC